jgi:hypothetical protein
MTKKAPLPRADGNQLRHGARGRRSTDSSTASQPVASDAEYKVGPGRPPREYRFKPGKSGNPKGAKPKPPSIALDLKLALERALNKTVKLKQGEKERVVTMAVAGIEQLVAQLPKVTGMPGATSSLSRTNLALICWRASTKESRRRSPQTMKRFWRPMSNDNTTRCVPPRRLSLLPSS